VLNFQWTNSGQATKPESGGWVTSQTPKAGPVVDPRAGLMGWTAAYKTELPCWGRNWPNRLTDIGQNICCLVKTIALTTLHELIELHQLPVATFPVYRRNQILLTSQSPSETTSKLPLVY
jgi:hypothetical protein